MSEFTVALAGNPNVGKSTIFNILTGLHQHVGNWPGKTVEKKEGTCRYNETDFHIVDLPGTYSLTANSIEELIARDYIVKEKPDVVVAIVDASAIERNLYLVTELLELTSKIVIALNMMDLAELKGYKIEPAKLQEAIGVPVVPLVATKVKGIKELLETVSQVASGNLSSKPTPIDYLRAQPVIKQVQRFIGNVPINGYNPNWLALKLLEGDAEVGKLVKERLGAETFRKIEEIQRAHEHEAAFIADARYSWIRQMLRGALRRPSRSVITFTDKVDHIVTHPFLGVPVLLGIFAIIFWLTFHVAAPFQNWIDAAFSGLGDLIPSAFSVAPNWLTGLLADGILAGLGGVLTLLPVLIIFFIFLALLEDSGYLARAAFVTDPFMHIIKLHGKAFFSLLVAYGCNIPGIMATRVLEREKDRIQAILINPLIPCTPRLSVAAFFTAAFFPPNYRALVMFSVLSLSLILVFFAGFLIRRFFFRGEEAPFIMELPLYRSPTLRNVSLFTWERLFSFLKRAGTIIVLISIFIWVLSNFPAGKDLPNSYLGQIGKCLEPISKTIGLDWKMAVALLTGFAAKETSVATLGVIYHSKGALLAEALRQNITPLVAYVFVVFQLLYIPCLATVATIYRETNSLKWTVLAVTYPLILAFTVSFIIFQIGKFLGF